MLETHAQTLFSGDNITVMIVISMVLCIAVVVALAISWSGAADRRKQELFRHLDNEKDLKIAQLGFNSDIEVAKIQAGAVIREAELQYKLGDGK